MTAGGLSGRWIGRYDYIGRALPAVAFEAVLEEAQGDVKGSLTEPNAFRPDRGATLRARLIGARDGAELSFVKYYIGFDQDDDPHYKGVVNPSMTRIEGRWWFPTMAGWGGRFVMTRERVQAVRRSILVEAEV